MVEESVLLGSDAASLGEWLLMFEGLYFLHLPWCTHPRSVIFRSFETLGITHPGTQRHIIDKWIYQPHCYENLAAGLGSCKLWIYVKLRQ